MDFWKKISDFNFPRPIRKIGVYFELAGNLCLILTKLNLEHGLAQPQLVPFYVMNLFSNSSKCILYLFFGDGGPFLTLFQSHFYKGNSHNSTLQSWMVHSNNAFLLYISLIFFSQKEYLPALVFLNFPTKCFRTECSPPKIPIRNSWVYSIHSKELLNSRIV